MSLGGAISTRSRRAIAVGALVVAVGAGTSACTTAIAQVRSTQLSLFCVVHAGESRASVYSIVGPPSRAGGDRTPLPALFERVRQRLGLSGRASWGVWVGPTDAYVVIFRGGHAAEVGRLAAGTLEAPWSC